MAETVNNSQLLAVRLVCPDRLLLEGTATAVELPSSSGYLETLYGAAPLLAELGAGEVRLHGGSADGQRFFVARGFAEVLPERVTILAETALKPEEIDTERARQELEHGHQLWNEAGDDAAKYSYANRIVREAEGKLNSAGASAA
jgi:F-type H+-transporting ATPase subunit epsilon